MLLCEPVKLSLSLFGVFHVFLAVLSLLLHLVHQILDGFVFHQHLLVSVFGLQAGRLENAVDVMMVDPIEL